MLYRTKPRFANAKRLTENTLNDCRNFVNPNAQSELTPENKQQILAHGLSMKSNQKVYVAELGDYIVKHEDGQCYPCKPIIFEALYEQVLDEGAHLVH